MLTVTFENGKKCNFNTVHKILCSNQIMYTNIDLIDALEQNDEGIVLMCYTDKQNLQVTHWDFFKKKDAFFYSDGFHSKITSQECKFTKQDITNFLCSTKKYHVWINNNSTSDEIIKISNEIKELLQSKLLELKTTLECTIKNYKLTGIKDIDKLYYDNNDFDEDTQSCINKIFYTCGEHPETEKPGILHSGLQAKSQNSQENIQELTDSQCTTTGAQDSKKSPDQPHNSERTVQTSPIQDSPCEPDYKNLYIIKKIQELENQGYSEHMAKEAAEKDLQTLEHKPDYIKKIKKYLGVQTKKQYSLKFNVSKLTAKVIFNFLTDHNLDTVTEIWPIISVLFGSSKIYTFKNKTIATVLTELIECSKDMGKQVCFIPELEKYILCDSSVNTKDTDNVLELFNLDGKYDALVLLKINDNYVDTYGIIQNINYAEEIDSSVFGDWHTVLLDQISTSKRIFTKEQKHKLLSNYSRVFCNILDIGDVDIHVQNVN
jgi:hypothetical protein